MPAPIVNGGGDRLGKVQFSELQKPRGLDVDPGSGYIRHTVVHHSSTSIYTQNFIEIGKTFCGRMYGWTFQTASNVNRSTRRSRPNNKAVYRTHSSCLLAWSKVGSRVAQASKRRVNLQWLHHHDMGIISVIFVTVTRIIINYYYRYRQLATMYSKNSCKGDIFGSTV